MLLMHSFVTSKNVKWCHLIWPTLYTNTGLRTATARIGSNEQAYSLSAVWWWQHTVELRSTGAWLCESPTSQPVRRPYTQLHSYMWTDFVYFRHV